MQIHTQNTVSFAAYKKALKENKSTNLPAPETAMQNAALPPALSRAYFMSGARFSGSAQNILSNITQSSQVMVEDIQPISFKDFLGRVEAKPKLARNAAQRILDMVLEAGVTPIKVDGEDLFHYHFFDNAANPQNAIFGMEKPINLLMAQIKAAAKGGTAKGKILLLVGPVGTAKTTIITAFKEGLYRYSRTDEGATYTFQWDFKGLEKLLERGGPLYGLDPIEDAMAQADPLLLIPSKVPSPDKGGFYNPREALVKGLNENLRQQAKENNKKTNYLLNLQGDASPRDLYILNTLIKHYGGDMEKAFEHVKVKRLYISESDRKGIGHYEARDDKSHRASQLAGEVDFRKLANVGRSSHPLAFGYDGELLAANRGMIHLDEMIKYPEEIWRVLLTASQDRKVKPDENVSLIDFDGLMLATTNIPEWESRIRHNKNAEAIRDRIVPIAIPYNSRLSLEQKIYEKTFIPQAEASERFVSPHTTYIAALAGVMSRLDEPTGKKTLLDKAKLYDGQSIDDSATTQATVNQMKKDASEKELMDGVSPRLIGQALDAALEAPDADEKQTVTPFHFLTALEQLVDSPITSLSEKARERVKKIIPDIEKELDRLYYLDVRKATAGDTDALQRLCNKYVAHLEAWKTGNYVKDMTGRDKTYDKDFLEAIEGLMGVSLTNRETFRKDFLSTLGLVLLNKPEGEKRFLYKDDQRLQRALETYLMNSNDSQILPISTLAKTTGVNEETQKKIDLVTKRLMEMGYNEVSAEIAMHRAASIKNPGDD